ncbi:wax ester/triacylglycerol synthase domain-containing protein [Gordonia insulae]|uniref:wax ester/triacylglycerol synthase domain-containing protein n=1 Tax=Gordonia insulae TaxID=2420509 RepID=UPI000F5BBA0D|nr:wax ester/triacylglycerol synthase domain-containing protein [Gordonia insulae]
MTRLEAADATSYWLSDAIPNDEFLLYCFAAGENSIDELADEVRRRAGAVADLGLRVLDVPGALDWPRWVSRTVVETDVVVHQAETWEGCLGLVASLMGDQLVASRAPWRVHLVGPVADTPRGPGIVVVLQMVHALGDGRRGSAIARQLFGAADSPAIHGDRMPVEIVGPVAAAWGLVTLPVRIGRMWWLGARAFRAVRDRDATSGALPTSGAGFPPTVLNRPPGAQRCLRVIVVDRSALPAGYTVTVGALTAISVALGAYLGEGARPLGIELTVGRDRPSRARNNFRNAGIDLHLEINDLGERASAIAGEIAGARAADADPAAIAERHASAAAPPMLTRWGTRLFDPNRTPDRMTGVSVVSSVYRGPADLTFGTGPVLFTAGFPALSPAQGLTHGVHGIGGTVAISVTTSHLVMPDPDRYLGLLDDALGRVRGIGRCQDSPGSAAPPDRG